MVGLYIKKQGLLRVLGQGSALAALALFAYWPSFRAGFHLDDFPVILNNHFVKIADLKPGTLFRASFQDFGNSRPAPNLTLALNYYFNQDRPFGYHVFNFGILLLTAFGVWVALAKLMKRQGYERAEAAAWLVALVWAVHPANTQAVTYVVQRYASMAGMFSVWCIAFMEFAWEGRNRKVFFALSILSGLFALASKETAFTLPALVLLYKLYFFDEFRPGWVRRNGAAIALLSGFYLLALGIELRPVMLNKILGDSAVKPFTLHDRILTEPRVLLWYLRLILFPFPKYLSLWHDFTLSKSLSDPWTTFASVFLIFIMLDVAVIMAREWRVFSFAVLWYLGSLLVEALPLPIDLVQEHRVYVASLGLMAPLIAWPGLKAGRAASVFLIIAIVLSVLSFERNRAWATEETLWRDALTKAPSTYRPWDTYCETLRKAGRNAFPTPICKTTPRPKEEQAEEHFNLGIGYLATQQYGLAETEFQAALQIEPANFKYLGNLGACYLLMGKYELAEQALLKAVEIKPDYSYAHRNLAGLFWVTGKIELAGNELLKAAEFNGQVSKDDYLKNTLTELARAIASQGKCGETVKKIKESNARSGVFANFESVCQEESGQIIKTKQ